MFALCFAIFFHVLLLFEIFLDLNVKFTVKAFDTRSFCLSFRQRFREKRKTDRPVRSERSQSVHRSCWLSEGHHLYPEHPWVLPPRSMSVHSQPGKLRGWTSLSTWVQRAFRSFTPSPVRWARRSWFAEHFLLLSAAGWRRYSFKHGRLESGRKR